MWECGNVKMHEHPDFPFFVSPFNNFRFSPSDFRFKKMRKVEANITISQPATLVFDAFTDPVMLKGWWGVERCLIEKKKGGLYSLAWQISEKGFGYISTGVVTLYNRGHELMIDQLVYFNPEKMILGPTSLLVKFRTMDRDRTQVLLTQSRYQDGGDWDWYYDSVREAWPEVLKKLKSFVENVEM